MMVDSPGSPVNLHVHDAFKPIHSGGFLGMGGKTTQVKRVEHRVQFHEYLVRYNQVLYENTMTVTFTYTSDPGASGTPPAPTNKSGPDGPPPNCRTSTSACCCAGSPPGALTAH